MGVDNEWVFIFGWTIPLNFLQKKKSNKVCCCLSARLDATHSSQSLVCSNAAVFQRSFQGPLAVKGTREEKGSRSGCWATRAHQQLPLCLWSLPNRCTPRQPPRQPARAVWPPRAVQPYEVEPPTQRGLNDGHGERRGRGRRAALCGARDPSPASPHSPHPPAPRDRLRQAFHRGAKTPSSGNRNQWNTLRLRSVCMTCFFEPLLCSEIVKQFISTWFF